MRHSEFHNPADETRAVGDAPLVPEEFGTGPTHYGVAADESGGRLLCYTQFGVRPTMQGAAVTLLRGK